MKDRFSYPFIQFYWWITCPLIYLKPELEKYPFQAEPRSGTLPSLLPTTPSENHFLITNQFESMVKKRRIIDLGENYCWNHWTKAGINHQCQDLNSSAILPASELVLLKHEDANREKGKERKGKSHELFFVCIFLVRILLGQCMTSFWRYLKCMSFFHLVFHSTNIFFLYFTSPSPPP